jgi:ATPase subunit of ABC transporter with duplicated ATPase domains
MPYAARDGAERSFRTLLGREEGGFDRDIGTPEDGGLLGDLFAGNQDAAAFESRLEELRAKLLRFAGLNFENDEVGDRRFVNHLASLPPEAADRIELWSPDDTLDVQYSPTGDGRNWRAISEGSPGQRTAALLAFLLAYGDEPIILDQPEDDLDNKLVYNLIVGALRAIKHSRQVVVVTHNANIVVNGDAELVIALEAQGGQTREAQGGSLQSQEVRDTICELMEGGRDAFHKRYRRISLT